MDPSSKTRNAKRDRTLRLLTLVSMIPALALLIPSGVIYGIALPALGLLPMCLSCVVSLMALGSKKDAAYANFIVTGADFVTAALLMFLMVISWISMANSWKLSSRGAMLGSYGLVPLMVNFCIHTYLSLRSPTALFQPRPCPNCAHVPPSALRWQRHVALPADSPTYQIAPQGQTGPKEFYASPAHAYDGGARESSEFQTSGFNTPRQSAETLRSEVEERESGEGMGGIDRKVVGSLV